MADAISLLTVDYLPWLVMLSLCLLLLNEYSLGIFRGYLHFLSKTVTFVIFFTDLLASISFA